MKYASPNYMIRIEIMWSQWRNLYNSQTNHVPLPNFQHMAAADAIGSFQANCVPLKYEPKFYFSQKWFPCIHVC